MGRVYSLNQTVLKTLKSDFNLAYVSGDWQKASNLVFLLPLREEFRFLLECLDAIVRVKVTLSNDWP